MRRLRVGRKLGRTLYEQNGDEPSDDDRLIGMMDNETEARRLVRDCTKAALLTGILLDEDIYIHTREEPNGETRLIIEGSLIISPSERTIVQEIVL